MSEPIRPTAEPPAPAARLTPVEDRAADPDQPRRRVTNVTVAIISILSIIASGYWLQDRLAHVHVSDARIASSMVTVSTRVPGWVASIEVSSGREIAAGDLVAVIDHRQARLELELAQASLASARAELERIASERELLAGRLAAKVARAESELIAARAEHQAAVADLVRASSDWERTEPLHERGIITSETLEQKQSEFQQAEQRARTTEAQIAAADAAVAEARANEGELQVFDNQMQRMRHDIAGAEASRDILKANLDDHEVRSPISGIVDEIYADRGEYVRQGQQILIMHDPGKVWVAANIKETDIRHIAPGKPATITVDAYPDHEFTGKVFRVGDAATSQFSLLPSPNLSGNFTKITQRLKVLIDIERDGKVLKPGMMVEVEIAI